MPRYQLEEGEIAQPDGTDIVINHDGDEWIATAPKGYRFEQSRAHQIIECTADEMADRLCIEGLEQCPPDCRCKKS